MKLKGLSNESISRIAKIVVEKVAAPRRPKEPVSIEGEYTRSKFVDLEHFIHQLVWSGAFTLLSDIIASKEEGEDLLGNALEALRELGYDKLASEIDKLNLDSFDTDEDMFDRLWDEEEHITAEGKNIDRLTKKVEPMMEEIMEAIQQKDPGRYDRIGKKY